MPKRPPGPDLTARQQLTAPTSNQDGAQSRNHETVTVRNVDRAAMNRIRHIAVDSKRSLGEIVTEALQEWLDKQEATP